MEKEHSYSQTAPGMKENGKIINSMAREHSLTPMGKNSQGSGKKTSLLENDRKSSISRYSITNLLLLATSVIKPISLLIEKSYYIFNSHN